MNFRKLLLRRIGKADLSFMLQLQQHEGRELFGNGADAGHKVCVRRFSGGDVSVSVALAPDQPRFPDYADGEACHLRIFDHLRRCLIKLLNNGAQVLRNLILNRLTVSGFQRNGSEEEQEKSNGGGSHRMLSFRTEIQERGLSAWGPLTKKKVKRGVGGEARVRALHYNMW